VLAALDQRGPPGVDPPAAEGDRDRAREVHLPGLREDPAPFHVIPRGWAGLSLLAMILYEKFGAHQPLNRLCERYALEGVPIPLSTLADAVGAGCLVLSPVLNALERYVFSAERLHGDDTTVPVLAAGKTDIARC
jgi:transposase